MLLVTHTSRGYENTIVIENIHTTTRARLDEEEMVEDLLKFQGIENNPKMEEQNKKGSSEMMCGFIVGPRQEKISQSSQRQEKEGITFGSNLTPPSWDGGKTDNGTNAKLLEWEKNAGRGLKRSWNGKIKWTIGRELDKVVNDVSDLIKYLHKTNSLIKHLQEDMKVNVELRDHYDKVIVTQQEKFRFDVRKYQGKILEGYHKLILLCESTGDVTRRISKKSHLTNEEVDEVIANCILVKGFDHVEKAGHVPGYFYQTCPAGKILVDYSESLKLIYSEIEKAQKQEKQPTKDEQENLRNCRQSELNVKPLPESQMVGRLPENSLLPEKIHQNSVNIHKTNVLTTNSSSNQGQFTNLLSSVSSSSDVNNRNSTSSWSKGPQPPLPSATDNYRTQLSAGKISQTSHFIRPGVNNPPVGHQQPKYCEVPASLHVTSQPSTNQGQHPVWTLQLEIQHPQMSPQSGILFAGPQNSLPPRVTNAVLHQSDQPKYSCERAPPNYPPRQPTTRLTTEMPTYPGQQVPQQTIREPNETVYCHLGHPTFTNQNQNQPNWERPQFQQQAYARRYQSVTPYRDVAPPPDRSTFFRHPSNIPGPQVSATNDLCNSTSQKYHGQIPVYRPVDPPASYQYPPLEGPANLPRTPASLHPIHPQEQVGEGAQPHHSSTELNLLPLPLTPASNISILRQQLVQSPSHSAVGLPSEIPHDPTTPQKLTLKDQKLQAGDSLKKPEEIPEYFVNVIKQEKEIEDDIEIIEDDEWETQKPMVRVRMCAQPECTNVGIRICKACHSVIYCSDTCQFRHWKHKHREECAKLKELRDG
ncbi:hypothetical protein RUM43_006593 [Polyplax serrata]|uniref:MYND-type domain-containing protein n=1 Tax=Polyplax serrata TaxID=468196 RepID=A0AAN8PYV4_POLSC